MTLQRFTPTTTGHRASPDAATLPKPVPLRRIAASGHRATIDGGLAESLGGASARRARSRNIVERESGLGAHAGSLGGKWIYAPKRRCKSSSIRSCCFVGAHWRRHDAHLDRCLSLFRLARNRVRRWSILHARFALGERILWRGGRDPGPRRRSFICLQWGRLRTATAAAASATALGASSHSRRALFLTGDRIGAPASAVHLEPGMPARCGRPRIQLPRRPSEACLSQRDHRYTRPAALHAGLRIAPGLLLLLRTSALIGNTLSHVLLAFTFGATALRRRTA